MVALTRELVVQFAEEQFWKERARIAERVATRFVEGGLAFAEQQAALDLFRIALYDSEPLVRRVLAESIKHASALPSDIVRCLAEDVPEVSAPFLAASPLLGEDELLPLVKCGGAMQRAAIACRASLSERLLEALFGRTAAA
jgi:uncharacterized protein (DUF2336 family)